MDLLRVTDPLASRVLAFVGNRVRPAWMVGGFVRDQLLGRPSRDLDLAVPEGGAELARSVARAFGGAFFVLDQERDVARCLLNRHESPLSVDVAHLRAPDLGEDLTLRDFTINAMAASVPAGENGGAALQSGVAVIDPLSGIADLQRGLLRAASAEAFRDDPLRTLRGVRLAVELGFRLEQKTCDLIRRDADLLERVAAERIRDELVRIVEAPGAWQHVRLLKDLDLLRQALPEMQALVGVTQSEPHYLDVFDHTRAVMAHAEGILATLWPGGDFTSFAAWPGQGGAAVPASCSVGQARPDAVVIAPSWQWEQLASTLEPYSGDLCEHLLQPLAAGRTHRDAFLWAAMAHDWGKARTRTVGADWRLHFYQHEHEGAVLAEQRMHLLTFSANEASYLGRLVDLHMRPAQLARHFPPTGRALYRLYKAAGVVGPDVMLLTLADKMATRAPRAEADVDFWRDLLALAAQVFRDYFRERAARVDPEPLLDGRQVMAELGLSPGPAVGRLLEELREAQAVGEVATVEEARSWLRSHGSVEGDD